MYQGRKRSIGAKSALFGATLIWGSSFLIVKHSMDVMGPHVLLGIRFLVASIILCLIFHKRLKALNKDYFIKGGIIGVLLFTAYSLQTIGITGTTPGKNAFLTTIYVVLVPFFYWIVDKQKPDIFNYAAALITIVGIGLVSLDGNMTIQYGDAFTLAGGVFYAAHMVAVAKISKDKDPILITIVQFFYCTILSWAIAFLFEDMPRAFNMETIYGLFYLSVFCTAVALLLQNIGQKYTNPAPASIIMTLESVFGVIFSIIFYHEQITVKLFIGFLLIFLAVLISETKLSFIWSKVKLKTAIREDLS